MIYIHLIPINIPQKKHGAFPTLLGSPTRSPTGPTGARRRQVQLKSPDVFTAAMSPQETVPS